MSSTEVIWAIMRPVSGVMIGVIFGRARSLRITAPFYVVMVLLGAKCDTWGQTNVAVVVRHGVTLNGPGRVEGSMQQLLGEGSTLNSGFVLTGDFFVPGTPNVTLNAAPSFSGTVVGAGSASPTGYNIILNGGVSLGYLRTRTDPASLPTVPPPATPGGTRSVNINSVGQSYGDAATLRNLTLNSSVGQYAVPPGAYGSFSANSGSGFTLGVAGATVPAIYSFQGLTFNGNSHLDVVGPIIVTVGSGFSANGVLGATNQSSWLQLQLSSGGLTLNSGSFLHGSVTAPAGTVIVNDGTAVVGLVKSDRMIINGSGKIKAGAAPNLAPSANAQSVTTAEDAATNVVLMGTDPENGALIYTVLTQPTRGTLSGTAPDLTYTPGADESGSDSFTFKVNDGTEDSEAATVSITITPVNDAPVAQAQSVSKGEDMPVAIMLSGFDVEGSALSYTIVSGPTHGTLSGAAPDLTYTPNADFNGSDSFTYRVNDGELDSGPATVSVAITALNDQPVADSQTYGTEEDNSVAMVLSGADVDNDPLTFNIVDGPSHGSLTGTAPNLTYVPATNYFGADSFTVEANDGETNSVPATITINISPVNDRPLAFAAAFTIWEDLATNVVLTATDVEDTNLTYIVVTQPSHGLLTGTGANLVYSPAADFNGQDSFTFKASDGDLETEEVTVGLTVTAVNDRPMAEARSVVVSEDEVLSITLGGTDVDGDSLTFSVEAAPWHGTLTGVPPNLTYTPSSNYSGADSFNYVVSDGATNSVSATVSIMVSPVNDRPLVNAGTDQLENFGTAVMLEGSFSDDGDIPGGATVQTTWSKVSGPGGVVFADGSAMTTSATFSVSGIYVLRLEASDGDLVASDEVTIALNAAPVVSAGQDATIFMTGNVPLQGSVTDDGLPPGGTLQVYWNVISGPGIAALDDPLNPVTTAAFNIPGVYVLRLTANDSMAIGSSDVTITVRPVNHPPDVYAGTNQLVLFPQVVSLSGIVTDDGEPGGGSLTAEWRKETGPGAVTFADAASLQTTATFGDSGIYVLALVGNDSERTATNYVTITMNRAPLVSTGPDQITTISNIITLNGAVEDDGLPVGTTNLAWSLVSGPGQVLFTRPTNAVTAARFTATGNYLLRLTATDGHAVGSDDVAVRVRLSDENLPPGVSAGADQHLALTSHADLAGFVSDDGLPEGASLSISWSVVSGPASVNFEDAANPASGASFSAGGLYVLRLTVSDTEFTVSDEVKIEIYPDNQPPSVDAGPDQSIVTGPATLSGLVADDGLPNGHTITHYWLKVSGPGTVEIANTNSVVTTVTFSEAGLYVFRLSASDSQYIGTDDVTVTVTGNQPPIVNAGPDQVLDLVVAMGATKSTVTYPPNPETWRVEAGQPGLTGVWGNIGSATSVSQNCLAWSGTDLYIGGGFLYANGLEVRNLAKWDGCNYSRLYDPRPKNPANPGSPPIGYIASGSRVAPISARGQEVFVAGGFLADIDASGGLEFLSRWTGTGWELWSPRMNSSVVSADAMLATADGVYFGGGFRFQPGGVSPPSGGLLPNVPISFNIAKWDGTNWLALGEGIRGINSGTNWADANTAVVRAIAVSGSGVVYAGGRFIMETPSGFATNLAQWNGTNWAPVGLTLTGCGGFSCSPEIMSLALASNGDLYAGGNFVGVGSPNIARWDGTNWWPVGTGFSDGVVRAIEFHGGQVYAGGTFLHGGTSTVNRMARFDGTNWVSVSGGLQSYVSALAETPSGLYVGGEFFSAGGQTANRIAKWGGRELPTLNGPDPITVSGASVAGATVPVTVTVAHPCGGALTLTWNVDGGAAEFVDVLPATGTSAARAGSFTNLYLPGVHTLVVTLDDGVSGLITFSTTITVLTPATTTLNGSIFDDGLPSGIFTGAWDALSGPATVEFSQPAVTNAQPVTDASFTEVGTYVLRLTGSDTQFSNEDTLTVNVRTAGNPNLPPTVNAGTDLFIAIDEVGELNGVVVDDGLPVGNNLSATWSQVSGPGTALFNPPAANTNTLTATFTAAGTYVLRLTGNDGDQSSFDEVTVTVSGITNSAPSVVAGPDQTIGLSDRATLEGTVADDGLPFGTIDSNWSLASGPGSALFRVSNGTTYAQFSDVGLYTLRLSANDGRLASFDDVAINVLTNTPGPVVQILAPLDAETITAPTVVTGIVQSALLQSWTLEYRLKPAEVLIEEGIESPETAWLPLASGLNEVNSAELATFDPTLLLNGIYELRLTASDQVGRTVSTEPITLLVDKNMKIGNFTVSFKDLQIPLAGIPIEVIRTYDSRDKRMGDFGVGWHLDINNIRLQKNRNLGVNWLENSSGGFFPTYSIDSRSERIVTITFPGDKVYKFKAKTSPEEQFGVPITAATIVYEPLRETLGSLVSLGQDGDDVLIAGSLPGIADLFDYHANVYNPRLFRFTMAEGDEFVIDEVTGLQSMRDRNGNTLTVTTNGIFHSSGKSISFLRDDIGRITNIVDCAGNSLIYQYDGAGDLLTFVDRGNQTSQFTYDNKHRLLTLSDARGYQAVRNEFDDQNRLVAQIDASNHTNYFVHDLGQRHEIIADRLGNITVHEYDENGNVLRTTDALQNSTTYTYDGFDNLLTKVDALGNTNRYVYDAQFNKIQEVDALGGA